MVLMLSPCVTGLTLFEILNIDIDKEMEDDNVEARVLGLSERDQCWQPHYNPQSTVTAQMRIKIE